MHPAVLIISSLRMTTLPEPEVLDLEPLTRLMECINVAQRNSSSMVSKLKDFEHRLQVLDDKMLPIQKVHSHCNVHIT